MELHPEQGIMAIDIEESYWITYLVPFYQGESFSAYNNLNLISPVSWCFFP